jgi:hypothetical protein
MSATTSWRKAGHRSLIHRGYPRFVVRFNGQGVGKGKLLSNEQEFSQNEMAAGRVPEKTLETLVKDAEKVWPEMNAPKAQ